MASDVEVIWAKPTQEYFCEEGWTAREGQQAKSVICPSGKIRRWPRYIVIAKRQRVGRMRA
jgi:hypothetical protein